MTPNAHALKPKSIWQRLQWTCPVCHRGATWLARTMESKAAEIMHRSASGACPGPISISVVRQEEGT